MGARRRFVVFVAALIGAVLLGGVVAAATGQASSSVEPESAAPVAPTTDEATTTTTAPTTTATTAPPTTAAPTTTAPPPAPPPLAVPGALAPVVAGEAPIAALEPVALADQILQSEMVIRNANAPPELVAAAGRLQQAAYRRLGERPDWDQAVFDRTPVALHETIWRQATARREFRAMNTRLGENLPAWRIVDPAPAEELLAIYQEAEARFGVPWNVLAAVNLVETGMGRIVGLSVAGAQGPMQFMPATWEAYGMGGDVWNTRDAIMGAANYLAANGGGNGTPEGLRNALFRYNRSTHYIEGVLHYAAVMGAEPRTFLGMHAWSVVYLTVLGDIVLPTGYEQPEPIRAADWLAANAG